MKQFGGEVIGEGAFGSVFDSIDDIGTIDEIVYFPKTKSKITSPNIHKNHIFKLIDYPDERLIEIKNQKKLFIFFKNDNINTLTCIDNHISSIKNDSGDEFIVYRKFSSNLQTYLYSSTGGYQKVYKRNKVNSRDPIKFIIHVISNILAFLQVIHSHGYIHKDIKLDNILINNEQEVVVGDYGLLTKASKEKTNGKKVFTGIPDFMPPFCHFEKNNKSYNDNYINRMNCFFVPKDDEQSKYPRTYVSTKFFQQVNDTYKMESNKSSTTKHSSIDISNLAFKIDLHPTGIILLQLLHFFEISIDHYLYKFAKKLMSSNQFKTSSSALKFLSRTKKMPASYGG